MTPSALAAPSLLSLLSAASSGKLRKLATLRTYADGELVHNRGDADPGLSIVDSGSVRVGILDREGGFRTVSLLGEGQTFGEFTLFAGLPRTHDIVAVGATKILYLAERQALDLFDTDPGFARALLATSLRRTHVLLEYIDAGRLPLPERTGQALLTHTLGTPEPDVFPFPQSDLAATLGISRQSLSLALAELERHGFISRAYREIRIRNRDALSTWVRRTVD